ncbi:energy transducer TonB [Kordiimonas sp.]|uniref:energy transducer TonB n=1 Tax=Kordiimonas sp. TaxID=1970157 RepID=UPI003A948BC9
MNKNFAKGLMVAASLGAMTFGAAAQAGESDGLKAWSKAAGASVDAEMKYPAMAVRQNAEGFASFRVTIDRSGNVVDTDNVVTAKSGLINAAARRVVKNAEFPALPSDYLGEKLSFALHLNYAIAASGDEERALKRDARVTGREIARARGPVSASIEILDANAD